MYTSNLFTWSHTFALLLAQSKTELEITSILGVDQPTISRDVKALKQMSRQFVFDLAMLLLLRYDQDYDALGSVISYQHDIQQSPRSL